MIKAIIFDMDGVITRTESIQSSAESKVFATVGINISPEEIIQKYSGFKDIDMFKDVIRRYGIKADSDKLRKEKWKIVYEELAQKSPPIVPGVIGLIERLKRHGYPLAIGTSTNLRFVTTVVDKLHIKGEFEVIISGDKIKKGKPSPEIFLLAAKKLRVPFRQCLIIEDAPNRVKAAKAAGMKCIAITTSVTRDNLQDADCVIDSFDELTMDYIKSL